MTAHLDPGAAIRGNGHKRAVGRPRVKVSLLSGAEALPAGDNSCPLLGGYTLLSIPQTAKQLGCSTHTLARWARDGQGPRAVVLCGRRKGYLLAEVQRWLLEHQRGGGST